MNASRTTQAQRHSVRLHAAESTHVLDEIARKRRLRKQLEALEQDNFHEDPHAQLQWHKNIPKFEDDQLGQSSARKKKKKFKVEYFKQRFRKNFSALVEEETVYVFVSGLHLVFKLSKSMEISGFDAYNAARAPPSCIPPRQFCSACGFFSKYTCIRCGVRYCSIICRDLHADTRY
uniref:HIT-type domain-containing protein n=1 Tax=Elaeophora elaphi TaxID=1147741 RepID=A0A0R3S1C7_9BILA